MLIDDIDWVKVWWLQLSTILFDFFIYLRQLVKFASIDLQIAWVYYDRFGSSEEKLQLKQGGARETINTKVNKRETDISKMRAH